MSHLWKQFYTGNGNAEEEDNDQNLKGPSEEGPNLLLA